MKKISPRSQISISIITSLVISIILICSQWKPVFIIDWIQSWETIFINLLATKLKGFDLSSLYKTCLTSSVIETTLHSTILMFIIVLQAVNVKLPLGTTYFRYREYS